MVEACPDCDCSNIYRRLAPPAGEGTFRCARCEATFETPTHRPTKRAGPKPEE